MIFIKCLSFLLFINLYNSFKFMNVINHKSTNRIHMGCDYYIEQNLWIYYNDNTCNCIQLSRKRGYYSDTDIYDKYIMNINIENSNLSEWEKIKQYHLTPIRIPILVYSNNTFSTIYLSNKYKEMLESEIINNYYKRWDDIKEIIILEERYERDY